MNLKDLPLLDALADTAQREIPPYYHHSVGNLDFFMGPCNMSLKERWRQKWPRPPHIGTQELEKCSTMHNSQNCCKAEKSQVHKGLIMGPPRPRPPTHSKCSITMANEYCHRHHIKCFFFNIVVPLAIELCSIKMLMTDWLMDKWAVNSLFGTKMIGPGRIK